ncbi:hypothetical protein C1H46_029279 [Malus baccata]|uniref:RING-type E3 ubiquitin transferase n=1 Tax=Malus baccata TaxID=106549 RepID=A0A540LFD6_MALBA|nr:hypothetical protein C1H46_029279 [Malus baccata]
MPFEDTISGDSSGFLIVISGIEVPERAGLVLVGDGTCAVCLGEFKEGEYFRTLPECSHSFHVQCIDMWLYSQPSCPVCRANATPVTLVAKQS